MINLMTTDDKTVEISCSPELEDQVRSWFEIPILQGDRWERNGLIYFRFEISAEKMADLKKVYLQYWKKGTGTQLGNDNHLN